MALVAWFTKLTLKKEQNMELSGKKIAILAANGFEQSELEVPRDTLKKAGTTVEIVSLAAGEIKCTDGKKFAGDKYVVCMTAEGESP
jgi:putative intracellular protease/amidase